jgi:hypothetical protein
MPRRNTRKQSEEDDSDPSVVAIKAPQRIYQVYLLPINDLKSMTNRPYDNCS